MIKLIFTMNRIVMIGVDIEYVAFKLVTNYTDMCLFEMMFPSA